MTKLKGLHFAVVVLMALALVPVGAHLLALPNKIDLPQRDYFTVQAIYLGWWLPSGIILVSAIVTSLMLTILLRGSGTRFWLASLGEGEVHSQTKFGVQAAVSAALVK